MSMIGQKEPEWSGTAYVKGEQKPLSSKELAGKWHVLYWYPLDFTFVCPTEIKGFQEHLTEFRDDKGVIRAYHVNDTAVGRSPKEVLRTAQALQSGGLCGADWKKGDRFVA
jgi:alkyl hydroperoxide reductase subunit AhpC